MMQMDSGLPQASGTGSNRILYLSADGLLEPLGWSQIASYVMQLSRQGFEYEILSMEKMRDLSNVQRQQASLQALTESGARWTFLAHESGTAVRLARTYFGFYRLLHERCRSGNISLLHARSFPMAVIARRVARKFHLPYIFDARGYWIDERAESGSWLRNRAIYRQAKSMELKVARDAAAIVTLTELQRRDFQALFPSKLIVTIPTCVDRDRFQPNSESRDVPQQIVETTRGKLVIGLVGSINPSYRIRDSVRLFASVLALEPKAHLLCLTRQRQELHDVLLAEGIPAESFSLATVPHEEMPQWMGLMHWCLLLLESSPAKRASMPTKLAEMIACDVRPIQYGCNPEVSQIVADTGAGVVLQDLSELQLQKAAQQIVAVGQCRPARSGSYNKAIEYFSLHKGVQHYSHLLRRILPQAQHSQCVPTAVPR